MWFAREYPCYAPNSLLLDNALASMGAGVPSAMAAKLVKPEVSRTRSAQQKDVLQTYREAYLLHDHRFIIKDMNFLFTGERLLYRRRR